MPSLPQNEPNLPARQALLKQQQERYQFNFEYLAPLAMLDEVPKDENFSGAYLAERLARAADLPVNMLAAKAHSLLDPLDRLEDYDDLFTLLPKPTIANTFQTDEVFAEQRLSGANPMAIRRLDPSNPPSTYLNIKQQLATKGKTLVERNLYYVDYSELSFVQGGTYAKGKKYLPTPFALFSWQSMGYRDHKTSDHGELLPIAIQIQQNNSGRVYTPRDAHLDWLFAKLCVQIADGNHHEMSSHLCRTHFVMEPIAVVTARQLAEDHPLYILLQPHFRFMLANNELGRKQLIQHGGPVDKLLAGTLAESLQIVKNSFESWSLDQFSFPTEVRNRGMDSPDLPHFPYRDDGQLVWDAIHKFVTDYLRLFYADSDALKNDEELQNWVKELRDPQGGRIKGVPEHIQTLEPLIEMVTTIVFTCGPQHCAVNYTQYEYMALASNIPLAAYQDLTGLENGSETKPAITNEAHLMQYLPPYQQAAGQLQIMNILTDYRYDKLGYYDRTFKDAFAGSSFDTAVDAVVEQFKQNLRIVETEIDLDNRKRVIEYPYLKPSLILNSISI
ncbi:MAG: lipoxygenase family protein [Cyanobacteria bacterium P01_A01_bin.17]